MMLHEALRKAVREYGVRILEEKRLLFMLSDFGAFEEYPAAKEVLGDIVTGGAGKELVRLFLEEDSGWCISYAGNLRKSLSGKRHYREDLASYAVDSVLFGLGLVNSVTEPSDHGFDPVEHRSGAGRGGAGAGAPQAGGAQAPVAAGQGTGAAPGGSAAPSGNGGRGLSLRMKLAVAAAVLLLAACIYAGWLFLSADGQLYLGDLYFLRDDEKAARWYRKSAEQGNAEAQFNLGVAYYYGIGVSRDYAEAARWFSRSAWQGNSDAQGWLGNLYKEGQGVTRDYREALKWYLKSALQGNAVAQLNLGMAYAEGPDFIRDYSEAGKWLMMAAGQGNDDSVVRAAARFHLGVMYAEGHGVPVDYSAAASLFRKSAEEGDDDAEYALGLMYEFGLGVPENLAAAMTWYRKAPDQDKESCSTGLQYFCEKIWKQGSPEYAEGWNYEHGSGVRQDFNEACKLYRKASELGNGRARYRTEFLANHTGWGRESGCGGISGNFSGE